MSFFEDNNAAIAFANGESEFDRSKHILQQHRYCVEQQTLGTIKVEKIDTKLQRADQGTKILESAEHSVHTARNLNLSSDKFPPPSQILAIVRKRGGVPVG